MKHAPGKHVPKTGKPPFIPGEKASIPSTSASQLMIQKHKGPPLWFQPGREHSQGALGNLRSLRFAQSPTSHEEVVHHFHSTVSRIRTAN